MSASIGDQPDSPDESRLLPAYSYIRFSTREQAKGDSYRRQTAEAAKWAADHGYRIVEILADLGISAYRGRNSRDGALARFLTWVDENALPAGAAFIIESFDRFSRAEVMDVLPQFIEIINAGVKVVTLTDQREYTRRSLNQEPGGLMSSLCIMIRAHEESKTKAKRLAEVWAKKQRAADTDPSVKLTSRTPGWIDVVRSADGKKIVGFKENENVEVVRRIFQECATGSGCRAIAKRLNEEGRWRPFRRGRGWHPSMIGKLIRGNAVLGVYEPHTYADLYEKLAGEPKPTSDKKADASAGDAREARKRQTTGKTISGYYPKIIDEALWKRANDAMEKRNNDGGRNGVQRVNLLRGLARCAECGKRMVLQNKSAPNGGQTLVCGAAVVSAKCTNLRRWKVEFVEEALKTQLDDDRILDVLRRNQTRRREPLAELDDRIDIIKGRLRQYMAISDEQGLQNDADHPVVEQIKALSRQLKEAQEQRSSLASEREAPTPETARSSLALMKDLVAELAGAEGQQLLDLRIRMAQALRTLFEEIRFGREEVHLVIRLKSKPAGGPTMWALKGIEVRTNPNTGQEQYFAKRPFITGVESGRPMDNAVVISDGRREYIVNAD